MEGAGNWMTVCKVGDVNKEDVRRWDHNGQSVAIIRTANDQFFATADICTHEHAHMSDGFVIGDTIECPRHAACFNIRTGQALTPPARIALKTFPTKVENGIVLVKME